MPLPDDEPSALDFQIPDAITDALRQNPKTRRLVDPPVRSAWSAWRRRIAREASRQASHTLRKARNTRNKGQDPDRAGTSVQRRGTRKWPTRSARRNTEHRLPVSFSPLRLATRVRLLYNPQKDEYTVVLRRDGGWCKHALTLTVHGGNWVENPRWMGIRPDIVGENILFATTGTSQRMWVTQGWRAGPDVTGGVSLAGEGLFGLGGQFLYGRARGRGTETNLQAGSGYGTWGGKGTHVYDTTGEIRVTATYQERPRRWLLASTGNIFRKAPCPIPLSGEKDGALVFKVTGQLSQPDSFMPHQVRPVHRDSGRLTEPTPLPLSRDQVLALLEDAPGSRSADETVSRNHMRIGHSGLLAGLERNVFTELAPSATAWAFETPGTEEYEAAGVHTGNGQMEGHWNAMSSKGGWPRDKVFSQGQWWRNEAETFVHAQSQGRHARDVMDKGVVAVRHISGAMPVSSGSSQRRGWTWRFGLWGFGRSNSDTTGALPYAPSPNIASLGYRLRSRTMTETLDAMRRIKVERSGRMVRAGYTSTTYLVDGKSRSRRWGRLCAPPPRGSSCSGSGTSS